MCEIFKYRMPVTLNSRLILASNTPEAIGDESTTEYCLFFYKINVVTNKYVLYISMLFILHITLLLCDMSVKCLVYND